MRRRRPVVENMTEVAAAPAAMHFIACHAGAAVGGRLDRAGDWIVEAGPTGAALDFFLRGEQRLTASGAGKSAVAFLVVEHATAGRFGAVLAHDLVVLGREQFAPLCLGVRHGIGLVIHDISAPFGRYLIASGLTG